MAWPIRVMAADEQSAERITVTGELLRPNATYPRLAGEDSRVFALAGSLGGFEACDRVRVTGELADVWIRRRRRTIDVDRIRSAE